MNKLRRKFVLAVLASAAVVFALTVFFTFIAVHIGNVRREDSMTSLIEENGGDFMPMDLDRMRERGSFFSFGYNEESPYRLRFFIARYSDGELVDVDISHIASVDRDKAAEMADHVRRLHRATGYYGDFRYRITQSSDVILLDCADELDSMRSLILISSVISLLFVVLITVVFYLVSGKVLKPFEENARMQKRFITDASHELKTPLAIISANAEVLAYKDGENEWVNNITAQVGRMSGLINEMLTLSRLEEIETNADLVPVDMSALTREAASEFEEVFRAKGVSPAYDIAPDVTLNGQPDQLRRLVSVLVDNAAKYVPEGGAVGIHLRRDPRRVFLSVFNTCDPVGAGDLDRLFDRFYRPDSSRDSKTGGHGVGLSIAKRIADLHNGSIAAKPRGDGVVFEVELSAKLRAGKKG